MKKSLKKFIALTATVAVTASVAIGGTMAYYQDTASDVNVMTLGNVKIDQIEKERIEIDDDKTTPANVQDFGQAKPLYPAVGAIEWATNYQEWETGGSNQLFTDELKNVQDKMVFVENTGMSDAYVRTLFAFEAGDMTVEEINNGLMHWNRNANQWNWTDFSDDMKITVDGVDYYVRTATYVGNAGENKDVHVGGVLPAGETTRPSLLQMFLDSKATNETVAAFGETYDVLVLSQAVQTAGFDAPQTALDAGFGEVTKENAEAWFANIVVPEGFQVSNTEELAAAVAAGETEIWLNPGTYNAPAAAKGKTLTINGTKDAILEVVPAGQGEANGQLDYSFDGSTVTFNGITIKTNSQLYAGYARLSGTYNDCVIQNTYNLGTGNSEFNNCEINITNEYLRVNGAYSAIFNGCTFNTDGRAILVFQDGTSVAQTVTVKDCTFNATAAAKTWNGIHVAAVSIDGTNGTYVVNLEGTNTVDSDFNGLWQIKAGEANVTVNE